MSFYNTGNPVPSIDPRDLDDNAKILDQFANGTEDTYLDRLGVERKTLAGIGADADAITLRGDLADPSEGSTLVAWARATLTSVINTVARMFDAQPVNIWEFADLAGGYSVGGDPSTWDWTPAFQAAALVPGKKQVPAGTYRLYQTVATKITGSGFICDGADLVKFIIDGTFSGNNVFELGDSTVATITKIAHFKGASFDLGGTSVAAIALFGIRDGSTVKDIVINNFSGTAFRTSLAGSGAGAAAGKMCEGLKIDNIHAISSPTPVTGPIFALDGLFESRLTGSKALGYTLGANDAVGYSVGANAESRGVAILECSAANMVNFGGSTNINKGIVYGEWARDCWDTRMTFENIDGVGVEFHGGTASGTMQPLNCRSRDVRPFFSATLGKLNPLYNFRACNACQVTGVNHFSTVKANFQFTAENGFNNYAEFDINAEPSAVAGTIVVFDVGCLTSNLVKGRASGVALRKELTLTPDSQWYDVLPNGAYVQTDTSWTSENLGAPDQWRWRSALLATLMEISGLNNRVKTIAPFHAVGALVITTQTANGGGGTANYTPTMANADYHRVTFSNCTALNVVAPTGLLESGKLILKLTNGNGATAVTPAFAAAYHGAPSDSIPAGQSALYEFRAASATTLVYLGHAINV
jgi:hypothetical protein